MNRHMQITRRQKHNSIVALIILLHIHPDLFIASEASYLLRKRDLFHEGSLGQYATDHRICLAVVEY